MHWLTLPPIPEKQRSFPSSGGYSWTPLYSLPYSFDPEDPLSTNKPTHPLFLPLSGRKGYKVSPQRAIQFIVYSGNLTPAAVLPLWPLQRKAARRKGSMFEGITTGGVPGSLHEAYGLFLIILFSGSWRMSLDLHFSINDQGLGWRFTLILD